MAKEDLEILYEDNHVIVVYKPANILSQGDATGDKDLLTICRAQQQIMRHRVMLCRVVQPIVQLHRVMLFPAQPHHRVCL